MDNKDLPEVPSVVGTVVENGYTGGIGSRTSFPTPLVGLPVGLNTFSQQYSAVKSKNQLTSISDDQVEKIITGWDWFSHASKLDEDVIQIIRTGSIGDQSCFYHSVLKALVPTYQNKAHILAYSKTIDDMNGTNPSNNLYTARQRFTDIFRRSIADWLCSPAINPQTKCAFTETEAFVHLNTRPRGIEQILSKEVNDPMTVHFDPFNVVVERKVPSGTDNKVTIKCYKWAHNVFEDLVGDNKEAKESMITYLMQHAVFSTNKSIESMSTAIKHVIAGQSPEVRRSADGIKATHTAAITAGHITRDELLTLLSSKGITSENIESIKKSFLKELQKTLSIASKSEDLMKYYNIYNIIINDGLASGETANDTLVKCTLLKKVGSRYEPLINYYVDFIKYARGYVEGRRKMIDFIRTVLVDPSTIKNNRYPMADRKRIKSLGFAALLELLENSINDSTGLYYTKDQISTILNRDTRIGYIKDPEILALPITLNYFIINDGINIYNHEDTNDNNIPTFQLKYLLPRILPTIDSSGNVISRHDAGEDDIIAMMPFIVNVDIYLVYLFGDHMRVYQSFKSSSAEDCEKVEKRPSIVIHSVGGPRGGHFEVIGMADDDGIVKTVFEPNHPFIIAINEYIERLHKLGSHEAVYNTLKISQRQTPSFGFSNLTPLQLPQLPWLPQQSGPPAQLSGRMPPILSLTPSQLDLNMIKIQTGADDATAKAIWMAQNGPSSAPSRTISGSSTRSRIESLPVLKQDFIRAPAPSIPVSSSSALRVISSTKHS